MKISDLIENFILEIIGDEDACDICRNELASFFRCAPSQINYVLSTRFTLDRGYRIESKRGGGGYVRIERLPFEREPFLLGLLEETSNPVPLTRLRQIVGNMESRGFITGKEGDFLLAVTSDRALPVPGAISDSLRGNILRETILLLLKK